MAIVDSITENQIVTLEYALAHPDKRHLHVEWEDTIWLYAIHTNSVRHQILPAARPITPMPMEISVHAEIRKAVTPRGRRCNANVSVDWIRIAYSFSGLGGRVLAAVRNAAYKTIQERVPLAVAPIAADRMTWDSDSVHVERMMERHFRLHE